MSGKISDYVKVAFVVGLSLAVIVWSNLPSDVGPVDPNVVRASKAFDAIRWTPLEWAMKQEKSAPESAFVLRLASFEIEELILDIDVLDLSKPKELCKLAWLIRVARSICPADFGQSIEAAQAYSKMSNAIEDLVALSIHFGVQPRADGAVRIR
jgi:hypothetical protein